MIFKIRYRLPPKSGLWTLYLTHSLEAYKSQCLFGEVYKKQNLERSTYCFSIPFFDFLINPLYHIFGSIKL